MILTKEERAWVRRVNKALADCPSDRLSFYAGGDPGIVIIDGDHLEEIDAELDDPVRVAYRNNWIAAETIVFPSNVSSVCF